MSKVRYLLTRFGPVARGGLVDVELASPTEVRRVRVFTGIGLFLDNSGLARARGLGWTEHYQRLDLAQLDAYLLEGFGTGARVLEGHEHIAKVRGESAPSVDADLGLMASHRVVYLGLSPSGWFELGLETDDVDEVVPFAVRCSPPFEPRALRQRIDLGVHMMGGDHPGRCSLRQLECTLAKDPYLGPCYPAILRGRDVIIGLGLAPLRRTLERSPLLFVCEDEMAIDANFDVLESSYQL